jgi:hypothetical protein
MASIKSWVFIIHNINESLIGIIALSAQLVKFSINSIFCEHSLWRLLKFLRRNVAAFSGGNFKSLNGYGWRDFCERDGKREFVVFSEYNWRKKLGCLLDYFISDILA